MGQSQCYYSKYTTREHKVVIWDEIPTRKKSKEKTTEPIKEKKNPLWYEWGIFLFGISCWVLIGTWMFFHIVLH